MAQYSTVTDANEVLVDGISLGSSNSFQILDSVALKKLVDEPNSSKYVIDAHNRGIEKLSDLSQYPTVHSLDISFNIIRSLENLSTARELRELKAYNNRIESADYLRENFSLEKLVLTENQIERISTDFQVLTKLKALYLNRNKIAAVQNLNNCRMLLHLDLSQNHLTGAAAKGLNGLLNLVSLDLSNNELVEIGNLSHLSKLQDLNLSNNRLSSLEGVYPSCLQTYRAGGNPVGNLLQLPTMSELEEFYIENARISQASILQALSSCFPKLESLDLSENRISSSDEWTSIKLFKELKDLWIQGNPCSRDENCLRSILGAKPDLRTLNGVKDTDLDTVISTMNSGNVLNLLNAFNASIDTPYGLKSKSSCQLKLPPNGMQHAIGATVNHPIPLVHHTWNRIGKLEKIRDSHVIMESENALKKAIQHTKALFHSSSQVTAHEKIGTDNRMNSLEIIAEPSRTQMRTNLNTRKSGFPERKLFSETGTEMIRDSVTPCAVGQVVKVSKGTETSDFCTGSVFSFAKPPCRNDNQKSLQSDYSGQTILSPSICNQNVGGQVFAALKSPNDHPKQSEAHYGNQPEDSVSIAESMDTDTVHSPRVGLSNFSEKRQFRPPRSRKGFRRFRIPERATQDS